MNNKNAVIYARYSSDKQTEQSIEVQLLEGQKYAKANNLTVVEEYIDRALTGRNDDRPEFQRMIRDSKKKLFQFVIVFQFDRFARNRYDSAVNKAALRKNGAKVISVKEPISDDPAGILLESVLEGYAEFFSADLSQKIKANRKMNTLEGNYMGGLIPFGFSTENRKYVKNIEQSKTLVDIFKLYAKGKTIKEITEWLNNRNIKNRGKPFAHNTLINMLKNKKYIGILEYEGEEIHNKIPQLVTKELFDIAQVRMASNRNCKRGARARDIYMLTGKLFCGSCKTLMIGESGTSENLKVYNYYKCSAKKRKINTCSKKQISKDLLERIVIDVTNKKVLNDEFLKYAAHECYLLNERERVVQTDTTRLKNNLKSVHRSLKNLLKAMEQGIITDTTKNRLLELESEKLQIEKAITKIGLSTPNLTEEHFLFWFEQFKNCNIEDKEFQQKIIDIFINSIYLYDDKLIIFYNTKGPGKKREVKIDDWLKKSSKLKQQGSPLVRYPNLFTFITKDFIVVEIRLDGKKNPVI